MTRKKMYPVPDTPHLEVWEKLVVSAAYNEGDKLYVLRAKLPYARVRLHPTGKADVIAVVDTMLYDTVEQLCEAIEDTIKGDMHIHE